MARNFKAVAIGLCALPLLVGMAGCRSSSGADRGEVDALIAKAERARSEGRVADALGMLEKAKPLSGGGAEVFRLRSEIMEQFGDLRGAVSEMQVAHRQYPKDKLVLERLLELGRDFLPAEECESAGRELVALDPNSANGHFYLGAALARSNETARMRAALAEFTESQRLGPDAQTLIEQGRLHCRLGENDQAVEVLSQAGRMLDQNESQAAQLNDIEVWIMQRRAAAFWLEQAYRRLGRTKQADQTSAYVSVLSRHAAEIRTVQDRVRANPSDETAAQRLQEIIQYRGFAPGPAL